MLLQALCIISSSHVNSNWSYGPETAKLGVDLCDLDLWPWPFAWTSLLSLVITPENFMMIRWLEHSQKGVTDRQTDDNSIHYAAWSQLKMHNGYMTNTTGWNMKTKCECGTRSFWLQRLCIGFLALFWWCCIYIKTKVQLFTDSGWDVDIYM